MPKVSARNWIFELIDSNKNLELIVSIYKNIDLAQPSVQNEILRIFFEFRDPLKKQLSNKHFEAAMKQPTIHFRNFHPLVKDPYYNYQARS